MRCALCPAVHRHLFNSSDPTAADAIQWWLSRSEWTFSEAVAFHLGVLNTAMIPRLRKELSSITISSNLDLTQPHLSNSTRREILIEYQLNHKSSLSFLYSPIYKPRTWLAIFMIIGKPFLWKQEWIEHYYNCHFGEFEKRVEKYLTANRLVHVEEHAKDRTRGAHAKFRQSVGRYALQRLFIAWLESEDISPSGREAFKERMRPLILNDRERRTLNDHGGHRRAETEEDKQNAQFRFRGTFSERVAALPWL